MCMRIFECFFSGGSRCLMLFLQARGRFPHSSPRCDSNCRSAAFSMPSDTPPFAAFAPSHLCPRPPLLFLDSFHAPTLTLVPHPVPNTTFSLPALVLAPPYHPSCLCLDLPPSICICLPPSVTPVLASITSLLSLPFVSSSPPIPLSLFVVSMVLCPACLRGSAFLNVHFF